MDHSGHDHAGHNMAMTTASPPMGSDMGHHMAHDNADSAHSDHMDMGMKMYFHFDVKAVILFSSWKIDSAGGLVGSMIGIFLMAMFYEGLKYYREYLYRKSYASTNFSCINTPGDGPKALTPPIGLRGRMLSTAHLLQTLLHVVQVTLSYFLMLIFMTYNLWLCLAVVIGAAFGFFIFGWKKAIVVDITEHCH